MAQEGFCPKWDTQLRGVLETLWRERVKLGEGSEEEGLEESGRGEPGRGAPLWEVVRRLRACDVYYEDLRALGALFVCIWVTLFGEGELGVGVWVVGHSLPVTKHVCVCMYALWACVHAGLSEFMCQSL